MGVREQAALQLAWFWHVSKVAEFWSLQSWLAEQAGATQIPPQQSFPLPHSLSCVQPAAGWPSQPASLAIIHQNALPLSWQLKHCEWAQLQLGQLFEPHHAEHQLHASLSFG